MDKPFVVFDIETIPDVGTGRKLYLELAELSDNEAMTAMIALRQADNGTSFMQYPLHQIACLSFLWVDLPNDKFILKSLSLNEMREADIVATFLRVFVKNPTVISWNGMGFDLPVLMYRAMHHQLSAMHMLGFNDKGYYNNKADYTNRYSLNHIDIMDKFRQQGGFMPQKLDLISALCGYVGKGGIDGSMVVPMVQNNEWEKISTYCEADVINTWLIFLRYQVLIGKYTQEQSEQLHQQTQQFLASLPNHQAFLV